MPGIPRSWLFTPGSRPDRFAKALASAADAVILDLEDAVAPDLKDAARTHVIEFLASPEAANGHVSVRINPLNSVTGMADLAALAQLPHGPDSIVLPKAESPAMLQLAADALESSSSPSLILALVESALGVERSGQLARATPRLAGIIFGAADYCADLGQQVGKFAPDFARAQVVNSAASGGVVAIDSPFFDIHAEDRLETECAQSKALGYYGKAAIHPAQLDTIITAFASTEEEREMARRIIAAAPEGVGVLDGKMIDIAMVRWAQRVSQDG